MAYRRPLLTPAMTIPYNTRHSLEQYMVYAKTDCDKIDLTLGKAGLLVGSSVMVAQLRIIILKSLLI